MLMVAIALLGRDYDTLGVEAEVIRFDPLTWCPTTGSGGYRGTIQGVRR
jgi:hypothetical protein